MAAAIKVLDVSLPHDSVKRNALLKDVVWPVIRPGWTGQDIIEEPLTTGYINFMSIYHASDDVSRKRAVVVRVYMTEEPTVRHDVELLKMQVASQVGCFPSIRAFLQNGIIYDYAPGRNLRHEDLSNPVILNEIARSLARFHWCDMSAVTLVDRRGHRTQAPPDATFLAFLKHKYFAEPPSQLVDTNKFREERQALRDDMLTEINFIEDYLRDLELPEANTHNDFHHNNILYDDETGRVTFVDYECSGSATMAMLDLGYLFTMYERRIFIEKLDLGTGPESQGTKRKWISAYLRQKCELEGRDSTRLSEEEVDLWMTYLTIAECLVFLYTAGRWLFLLGAEINIPIKKLFDLSWRIYQDRKHTLIPLKEKCLQLRSLLSKDSKESK